jgi:hypothetical protein
MHVEDDVLDDFVQWAWEANALCFLPDGTVPDPAGRTLVDPGGQPADAKAEVPYPRDARDRKACTDQKLGALGINVPATLPPVIGAGEVELRSAADVAQRCLALFVVAVR